MEADGVAIATAAFDAFDAWIAAQSDEVQELDLLEQISLYFNEVA